MALYVLPEGVKLRSHCCVKAVLLAGRVQNASQVLNHDEALVGRTGLLVDVIRYHFEFDIARVLLDQGTTSFFVRFGLIMYRTGRQAFDLLFGSDGG